MNYTILLMFAQTNERRQLQVFVVIIDVRIGMVNNVVRYAPYVGVPSY